VVRDRAVEVEGIGEVEVGLQVQSAGVVDVVLVHRDMTRVDVLPPVLRIRGRICRGEVVPLDGLRHEPVQLRLPDPPGDGRDLRVDEPRRLTSEGG
jgi:hypothetical protein